MTELSSSTVNLIGRYFGGASIKDVTSIQSLWGGYGQIVRVELQGAEIESLIVKHVCPGNTSHPRGWNTDRSHQRKLRSYQVEAGWYAHWSWRCDKHCRVPLCFATENTATGQNSSAQIFLLQDLDAEGFDRRCQYLDHQRVCMGLRWLARFHARFLGNVPDGLWPVGTYWHLSTRGDEWAAMEDGDLKLAAESIDRRLSDCRFQTIVHGDAKVANFCFTAGLDDLAAVDFQYVGGGCGMKDVAYFLSSCVSESECDEFESAFLDHYFRELREAIGVSQSTACPNEVEREWREMYPLAWADFTRFLLGWCPEHTKLNDYSRRITGEVLSRL